jgi:hypothetical protein
MHSILGFHADNDKQELGHGFNVFKVPRPII